MTCRVLYQTIPARLLITGLAGLLLLGIGSPIRAETTELGRLFYTPAQREQLNAARLRHAQPTRSHSDADSDMPPAPVRYDGVVTRSDGKTVRWIDGKAQTGSSSVSGLKPGQVRANGQVYEPYQVLRPQAAELPTQEAVP